MGDFRETLYTVDATGRRKWVYPSLVRGFFYKRRQIVILALLLFYISMPWLEIAGKQAILFDIFNRKFVFFGLTFWATDTRFLVVVLGALAVSLFFFTALLGRVWCGWACPETVFLEFLFRPIEALIEGTPAERKKLDASPWNARKLRLKGRKYLVYTVLAWFLASTFLAYFVGREALLAMMASPPTENLGLFILTLVMMGVLLFQFGWFREQFCTVLCPYARFQSVLMDDQSLLVGYDPIRGEPRGKVERAGSERKHGDCVDCGLCVRVCPTGIDIRNGTQLECIHCAQCVDACDSIMAKVGRPLGLIRYDTEAALKGGVRRIRRPRVMIYGSMLVVYAIVFVYLLGTRDLSEAQLLRAKGSMPFQPLADGRISNQLQLHLSNKSDTDLHYSVESGTQGVELIAPMNPFTVAAGTLNTLPVFLNFDRKFGEHGEAVVIVRAAGGFERRLKVPLMAPDEDEEDEEGDDE